MPKPTQNTRDLENLDLDQLAINSIRTLSIDAVQAAKSGHPGTAMGMAPVVYRLWQKHLRYDPENPLWADRDRFVLSAGHASMLLYSILHLTGVKQVDQSGNVTEEPAISVEDIKRFRQVEAKCAGHPEYGLVTGIETTTGPLGQGVANSVGMAIAGKWLGARYNQEGLELTNYDVYALAGDGCMMEGISSEAASLAGHLRLSNLCWLYDRNRISIEGSTDLAFTEDVGKRFKAQGWLVVYVEDANDLDELDQAFEAFKKYQRGPTLIIIDSHIGYGSPNKQDKASAHGEPLGEEEVRLTKKQYGWPEDAKFFVPDQVYGHFNSTLGKRGSQLRQAWQATWKEYEKLHAELASEWTAMQKQELPEGWDAGIEPFPPDEKGLATRASSGKVLNEVAKKLPWLVGGSADLAPSTKTLLSFDGDFQYDSYIGRNLRFGVREHAMMAVVNGMTLSGLKAYGSSFLVFSDYARPSLRLGALMEIPAISVFTHDSVAVGEDGPTHQPVEHLGSLRMIPGLTTIRPADANEVIEAWRVAIESKREPVSLILSRQNLPTIDRNRYNAASGVRQGAYVLAEADDRQPQVLLMASGSEVSLCLEAYEILKKEGIKVRVISMPSWELFERQKDSYKEQILPRAIQARVAIELGSTFGWERYTGMDGVVLGMDGFGASGPMPHLMEKFGFNASRVVAAAKAQLKRNSKGNA